MLIDQARRLIMVGYLPGLDTPAAAEPQWKKTTPATATSFVPLEVKTGRGTDSNCIISIVETMSHCCSLVCILAFLAIIGGFIVLGLKDPDTRYSVSIDSVSGLDPATDLRLPALDPAFNLTLRVYSASVLAHACIDPGMYLEVAYRCVTLAASPTVQQPLCVGPKEAADQRIVAMGTGVRVSGAMLDSLSKDMRQGVLVFQVTIRQSDGVDDDDELVASCGGRRVGAATTDLGTRCDAFHLCTDVKS